MFSVLLCRCRIKTRKRHRYSLLREVEDDDDKDKLELMPKGEFTGADVKFCLYECVLFFSGLTEKKKGKKRKDCSRPHLNPLGPRPAAALLL